MADYSQNQNQQNWPLKADATEAYDTFRKARTLCFWFMLLGLILVAAAFWTVDRGMIDSVLPQAPETLDLAPIPVCQSHNILTADVAPPSIDQQPTPDSGQVAPPTQAPSPDQDAEMPAPEQAEHNKKQALKDLVVTSLATANFILPFLAVLYCLCLLIGMKLTIVGRLDGLAHSAKAFFLALLVMVLVVPWQQVCANNVTIFGTLFTFDELARRYTNLKSQPYTDLWTAMAYYARFTLLWALALILLLVAQWRSHKAARTLATPKNNQPGAPSTIAPDQNAQSPQ